MKVLVAGGSGFVGTRLCRELADRGHDVTALSRTPGEDLPEGVDGATGDVTAFDSIADHVDGQDAVVNLVALSPLFKPTGGDGRQYEVHLGGTRNLVRAAEEGGADRFLQQSAIDADPDGLTHHLKAKGQAEEVVRDSDLDWTILRPSVIFGEGSELVPFTKMLKRWFAPGIPLYPLPGGGERTRFQPIWVEDLAGMMADAVVDDEHVGATYELGGPEVLTLRDVVEKVFAAEGRSVRVVPLPMGLAKVGLTAMGAVPGFPMGPDQYRGLKVDNTTEDNDVGAFGVDPDDLQRFDAYLGVDR